VKLPFLLCHSDLFCQPDAHNSLVFLVVDIGVTEEEMCEHLPNEEMKYFIATFGDICGKELLSQGVVALYSYESQIPAICISKMDGLQKHYSALYWQEMLRSAIVKKH